MKAALFKVEKLPLSVEDIPKPVPTGSQVLIKIKACALNHRDLWIQKEQNASAMSGITLGSDGCGIIEDAGEEVEEDLVGQEVIINPSLGWGKNPNVQADSFRILGLPDAGTFAEYITISRKQVVEKPENLSFEESAAIPLSGLTAYRALFTKARLRPGEKVLVTGIGGGASLFAFQFAMAFKCSVFVTSGSSAKLQKAIDLGAAGGFNYKETDWMEKARKAAGGFDVIIDGAGGDQFPRLLDLAVPGGRIVNFGRTAGDIGSITPRTLYWKQLSISGTSMGTHDEFLSMLDFIYKHKIKPVVDKTYSLPEINEAFAHLEATGQFGKVVIRI